MPHRPRLSAGFHVAKIEGSFRELLARAADSDYIPVD